MSERESNAQPFRLPRDNARDVTFTGWHLGHGATTHGKNGQEHTVTVDIYETRAGKYVIHVQRSHGARNTVSIADTPADVVAMMHFGTASLEAWHEACRMDAALAALETEVIT